MKTLQAILIVMFLGLTLTSYAQERGHSFSPNYQGYYYLRTAFTGDQFSLESNDPTSSYMNGATFQKQLAPNVRRFLVVHLGLIICFQD